MRSTNLKSAIDCHIAFFCSGCWIQKREFLVSFGGIHILRLLVGWYCWWKKSQTTTLYKYWDKLPTWNSDFQPSTVASCFFFKISTFVGGKNLPTRLEQNPMTFRGQTQAPKGRSENMDEVDLESSSFNNLRQAHLQCRVDFFGRETETEKNSAEFCVVFGSGFCKKTSN